MRVIESLLESMKNNKVYRVLDFHDSAKRCSSLLLGVKCATIRPAKSTFKKVFFAAALYV